jgi:pimeloyl-ACP methyl ester carboxylesterase
MDAARSKRAAVFGLSEGGWLATSFAAHYPERCQALVLWGAFAKFSFWIPTTERLNAFFDYVEKDWGTGTSGSGRRQKKTIPHFKNGWRNENGSARAGPR